MTLPELNIERTLLPEPGDGKNVLRAITKPWGRKVVLLATTKRSDGRVEAVVLGFIPPNAL